MNAEILIVDDNADIRNIINELIIEPFDNSIVLNINSPHKELADYMEKRGHKIKRVQYQPTCEMMILDFAEKINLALSNITASLVSSGTDTLINLSSPPSILFESSFQDYYGFHNS